MDLVLQAVYKGTGKGTLSFRTRVGVEGGKRWHRCKSGEKELMAEGIGKKVSNQQERGGKGGNNNLYAIDEDESENMEQTLGNLAGK